jgi:hypothetical protein
MIVKDVFTDDGRGVLEAKLPINQLFFKALENPIQRK